MTTDYHFQLIPYTTHRIDETISISKAGRLGLTHYFVTTHSITKTTRARLWFDADSHGIAMALTHNADSHAFPIGFTKSGGAYIMALRSFFRANDLDPAHYAGRYDYAQVQAETLGIPNVDTVFVVKLESRHKTGERSE